MKAIAFVSTHEGSRELHRERLTAMSVALKFSQHAKENCHAEQTGGISITTQLASRTDGETGPRVFIAHGVRFWVALDGCLHNATELMRSLELAPACTSEEEVVLRAWIAWGPACVERFYGRFGVVIWSPDREEAFFAVDHMAQRPLFYWHGNVGLLVASLPHAVAASGLTPGTLDRLELGRYILPCFPRADRTLFSGVNRLPGGHSAHWIRGHLSVRRYWRPETIPIPDLDLPEAEYLETIRQTSEAAVANALRLRETGNSGLLLSGGLDSSVLAAVAARAFSVSPGDSELEATASWPRVHTGTMDDSYFGAVVARHLELKFRPICGLAAGPDVLDRFFAATGCIPTIAGFAAKAAMFDDLRSRGVTMVLDGEGGECSVTSYGRGLASECLRRFRLRQWADHLAATRRLGEPVIPEIVHASLYPLVPDTLLNALGIRRCEKAWDWLVQVYGLTREYAEELHAGGIVADLETAIHLPSRWFPKPAGTVRENDLENLYLTPFETPLCGYGFGVENVCPWLDRRLIELVLSLSPSCRQRSGLQRRLARDAFRGQLPAEILDRRSKSPLFPDWNDWLTGQEVQPNGAGGIFRELPNADTGLVSLHEAYRRSQIERFVTRFSGGSMGVTHAG